MILYFIPQKLSVFIKFYGKGFHWTGGSWFNVRSTFHNNGIFCDQCCYGFPVLRNTSILEIFEKITGIFTTPLTVLKLGLYFNS